ncbi:hypothetical protein DFH28DRAFT_1128938 [Melampsora americana]|nr:hypothetical protein DFH28DRAFT_1128938 [Melampsora americana]
MSSFMNKSLALFVILCVMAPSMWTDARAISTDPEVYVEPTQGFKSTGSSYGNSGDSNPFSMSSQGGGEFKRPSGGFSQVDSSEKPDGGFKKKKHFPKYSHKHSQDSTKPSGSSYQADPSEQSGEDPIKKGSTSQGQSSDYDSSSSNPAVPPSYESPANQTSSPSPEGTPSGNGMNSTSTLNSTGYNTGERTSDSLPTENPAEKSNETGVAGNGDTESSQSNGENPDQSA